MSDEGQNPQVPGQPQPPYGVQPPAPGSASQPPSAAPQQPYPQQAPSQPSAPQPPYAAPQQSSGQPYPQQPYGQQPYGQQSSGQQPYGTSQSYPGSAGAYPGSAGAYPVSSYGASAPTPGGGLAIAALVVGIVAFLGGWLPVVGGVIALVGIVLGILVVRKPVRRGFGWTAIGLSVVALLTNIVMTVVLVVIPLGVLGSQDEGFPDSSEGFDEQTEPEPEAEGSADAEDTGSALDESSYSVVSGQEIDTPCWSYDGPENFVNNIDSASVEDCVGKLELWGEWDGDVFVPTGVGSTAGQILADPQLVSEVETVSPGSDVNAFVDVVEQQYGYFSGQGEILSLHEETTIGGVPANITRVDSNAETTKTKAFITVLAPHPYDTPSGQVQMFIISVTTPYSNGEEQIQQLLDTWTWK